VRRSGENHFLRPDAQIFFPILAKISKANMYGPKYTKHTRSYSQICKKFLRPDAQLFYTLAPPISGASV
jgi:hypothetical protein